MPETKSPAVVRAQRAADLVGEWVSSLPGARALEPAELRAYESRDPTQGWRVAVELAGRPTRLDLLLVGGFPRRPPRVAVVDRPDFLTWPHVEKDGALCLLPDGAEVDFTRPAAVAADLLASAADLVEGLIATGRPEDFRAEFNTYWGRAVPPGRPRVYSLLPAAPPSRMARVWRGRKFDLVGDQSEIDSWLSNRFRGRADAATAGAAVVWLPEPLLPSEFPTTPSRVVALAERAGGGNLLEQLVGRERGEVVVFAAPTPNGPCFAAVTLAAAAGHGRTATKPGGPVRGFRPGKVPRRLLVGRQYGCGTAAKSAVERADAPWVHGRGQDARFERLRGATVAVLGCGSVGAPVALQLAGAGVGGLVLIDPESLSWANVGRHPLGAPGVGRNKAAGLADLITSHYPHARRVVAVDAGWPRLGGDEIKSLADCDLLVSAIGDWAAEASLNEWHRSSRAGPIVYGWTEAHACAGHAVAVLRGGGCLQCGFSTDGTPLLRVTDWPAGGTVRQEPACGATYQPYGPVELGHVVSVLAETALDCLLGRVTDSTRRTWVGRRSLLEGAGGRWNPDWLARSGGRECGGFVEEARWDIASSCVECGADAA